MANNNNNKNNKTQNVPKDKGKGKDDDKQLARRAGPQSGQHNSPAQNNTIGNLMKVRSRNSLAFETTEDALGQKQLSLMNMGTNQVARNEMAAVSGYGHNTTIAFAADKPAGVAEVANAMGSTLLPDAGLPQQPNQQPSGESSGQDQGRDFSNSERRQLCVGCKSDRHVLAKCIKAGADGYMKGCPFCDTMEHGAGNCPHPALKDDKKLKVHESVFKRRNMPSFLNLKAWYPLVKANTERKDLAVHSRFPWTPEFTKSNAGRIDQLQRKIDEGHGKYLVDPKVKGWAAVVAYHRSLETAEKEKTLAQARAKVAPLSDTQKAVAALLSASLVPETRPEEPEQVIRDVAMAGNEQVGSSPPPEEQSTTAPKPSSEPTPESEYLALAKQQHDASQPRPWEEDSSDDNDDDDDEDINIALSRLRKREAELEATNAANRAKSYAER
ncbi:hypothetical protein FBULB1_3904 [Fusarium bulbicola]|nr:hypothetical protein FBULB1_3904 [Fusarium bulbicola]